MSYINLKVTNLVFKILFKIHVLSIHQTGIKLLFRIDERNIHLSRALNSNTNHSKLLISSAFRASDVLFNRDPSQ